MLEVVRAHNDKSKSELRLYSSGLYIDLVEINWLRAKALFLKFLQSVRYFTDT